MDLDQLMQERPWTQHVREIQMEAASKVGLALEIPKEKELLSIKQQTGYFLTRLASEIGPGILLQYCGRQLTYRFWRDYPADDREDLLRRISTDAAVNLQSCCTVQVLGIF
jgi:hypothetical protein